MRSGSVRSFYEDNYTTGLFTNAAVGVILIAENAGYAPERSEKMFSIRFTSEYRELSLYGSFEPHGALPRPFTDLKTTD